ncbi:MAG: hypothetical protein U9Q62_12160 [Campylobacterota bacterium]|nr:hypothetical protein [Campylobacterota bacterium]
MKQLYALLLLGTLAQGQWHYSGHIDWTNQGYLTRPDDKHSTNNTLFTELEAEYQKNDLELQAKVSAQLDSYDLQESSQKNERSFVRLDELYATYSFEDDAVMAGKGVRFWGALEVDNIVDGFNPDDLRSDLMEPDKLGVWHAAFTHYTDSGEVELLVKLREEDQPMAAYPYVYYFFPEFVTYDDDLGTEKSRYRPSFYLKWSGSTDTEYALDYAFIIENGYDSQRYFQADVLLTNFKEQAYLVNKLMSYNTLVTGATLWKLEALYSDVLNDGKVSDYWHVGVGVEHTLSQIYGSADLGLIGEYYRYETVESGKLTDLELFELFQDDLFLGMRYSFNDVDDASIVGGVVLDLEYDEQSYYVEYETRVAETFKLKADYRYIEPSEDTLTAFNLMGRHQRISVKIGYYF